MLVNSLPFIFAPLHILAQTERFTFLEEGRLVTITVGYHRLLYSKGESISLGLG